MKSDFIEKLTHDCYVVQIPLLRKPLRTKIDYIFSIFDQHRVYSSDKEGRKYLVYEEEPIDHDVEMFIKRLMLANSDKEIREKLEDAEYMERYYQEAFGKKDKKIVELEGNIAKIEEELKQEKLKAEQEKAQVANRSLSSGMSPT